MNLKNKMVGKVQDMIMGELVEDRFFEVADVCKQNDCSSLVPVCGPTKKIDLHRYSSQSLSWFCHVDRYPKAGNADSQQLFAGSGAEVPRRR